MQAFTSSATSINRDKLPAVFRKADFQHSIVFDYGCGKYTEHIESALFGHTYLAYDPYNQPQERNETSLYLVRLSRYLHYPIDIVCSNVLNVIDDDETVRGICAEIESIAEETGGTAFVTVYEGDRSGSGRQTGQDQYQRNEPLRNYLRFFRNATIKKGMLIVKGGA